MKNKVTKQEWVDALRSGKYKQGKNFLCNDKKYCCLGVLADLLNLLEDHPYSPGRKIIPNNSPGFCSVLLPQERVPSLNEEMQGHLSSLNDNGYSFEVLAKEIETSDEIPDVIEKVL